MTLHALVPFSYSLAKSVSDFRWPTMALGVITNRTTICRRLAALRDYIPSPRSFQPPHPELYKHHSLAIFHPYQLPPLSSTPISFFKFIFQFLGSFRATSESRCFPVSISIIWSYNILHKCSTHQRTFFSDFSYSFWYQVCPFFL